MIENKEDLKYYMVQDRKALRKDDSHKKPRLFSDEVWKFEIALRKAEYATNCKTGGMQFFYRSLRKFIYHKWSVKCGFTIPLNVFKEGLSIAHYGTIVVNSRAKIGKNCRIQENVNIGSSGDGRAPVIGDNVFIGSGAKLIGDIKIASRIAIGAGAVVVDSFEEEGITIAGVPAKKISNNDSTKFLSKELDL